MLQQISWKKLAFRLRKRTHGKESKYAWVLRTTQLKTVPFLRKQMPLNLLQRYITLGIKQVRSSSEYCFLQKTIKSQHGAENPLITFNPTFLNKPISPKKVRASQTTKCLSKPRSNQWIFLFSNFTRVMNLILLHTRWINRELRNWNHQVSQILARFFSSLLIPLLKT